MFKNFFILIFVIVTTGTYAEQIDLSLYEKSLYSQNGEDGVIAKIFQLIKPTSRFCIDLGAGDGVTKSNTYLLRIQGWIGQSFDRSYETPKFHLNKEFITAENINDLFEEYNVPKNFDLLCINLGYNDFYIWQAISKSYQPTVVLIEYNGVFPASEDKVVKYRPYFCGDGFSHYFGASILALYRLGRSKGYTLVYAESHGGHLFFILDEILREKNLQFKDENEVEKIFRIRANGSQKLPEHPKNHEYFSSTDLIE